jgi:hypothetical protein
MKHSSSLSSHQASSDLHSSDSVFPQESYYTPNLVNQSSKFAKLEPIENEQQEREQQPLCFLRVGKDCFLQLLQKPN